MAIDLFSDLPEPTEVVERDAMVVSDEEKGMTLAAVEAERRHEKLVTLKEQLYAENLRVISDVAKFREVGPEQEEVPDEWITQFGAPEAEKMFRVAKAGWMSGKSAPVGLTVATKIVLGIIKADAISKSGPKTLNVNLIGFQAPLVLPEMDVEW